MHKPLLIFEVFRGETFKEWYWRAKHRNGRSVACGGEGYRTRTGCLRSLTNFIASVQRVSYTIKDGKPSAKNNT